MAQGRTKSMEIRRQLEASPPPPPAGTGVREWFAGLALMNPTLMKDVEPSQRAAEAVRLADQLIQALMPQRTPSMESISVPQEDDKLRVSWDNMANAVNAVNQKEQRERVTKPGFKRRVTRPYGSRDVILPPPGPGSSHFKRASDILNAPTRVGLPFPSTHSSFRGEPEE